MNFCASDFTEPVTLQSSVLTPDDYGGQVEVWSDEDTIWCQVNDQNNSEGVQAGRIAATGSAELITPYRDDITPKNRLIIEDETYNIRSVVDVGRKKRWIRIIAEFGVRT